MWSARSSLPCSDYLPKIICMISRIRFLFETVGRDAVVNQKPPATRNALCRGSNFECSKHVMSTTQSNAIYYKTLAILTPSNCFPIHRAYTSHNRHEVTSFDSSLHMPSSLRRAPQLWLYIHHDLCLRQQSLSISYLSENTTPQNPLPCTPQGKAPSPDLKHAP